MTATPTTPRQQSGAGARGYLPRLALFVLGSALVTLAYGQAPLYYSNQNQYFLHGLAWAGEGLLGDDWLAGTTDPTPAFSGLVAAVARYLHPAAFYAAYALLLGGYFAAAAGVFQRLTGKPASPRLTVAFLALVLLAHSALVRWGSYRLVGFDYPWFLQAGVAGQYVLGAMLQPSMFGVLLILAVALFLHDRPGAAVACVGVAGIMHSTYLLGGGFLILAFLVVLWREGRGRLALRLGALAALLALPPAAYVVASFRPTSPEVFAESQRILAHLRIPHHCLPRLWCDPVAWLQIGWVALAVALTWGTRLFLVLLIPFLAAAGLTLLQVATGNDTLALLFPWRVSVYLVPLATTILLGRLVLLGDRWLDNRVSALAATVAVVFLAAAGGLLMAYRQGYHSSPEEVPVMAYVRDHKRAGDLYLIPFQVPDLKATTRGSLSSDFKPLAAKKQDARLIPVDLQRFRLTTGAPIFVDFKSIPYRDRDVVEWHDRLRRGRRYYDLLKDGRAAEAVEALRGEGVTHVVTPAAGAAVEGSEVEKVYEDDYYRVYTIKQF